MKFFGLGMVFALLAISSFAQTPSLGLSLTGALNYDPGSTGTSPIVSLSGPAVGFIWQDRLLNAHEIKVSGVNFGVVTEAPQQLFCGVGFQYQYRQFFLRKKEPKFMPYFLVHAGMGVGYNKIFPSTISTQFPYSALNVGMSGGLGIGGRCSLSEKVYFDIGLPVTFSTMDFQTFHSGDPSVISTSSADFRQGFYGIRAEGSFGFWLGNRKLKDKAKPERKEKG